VHNSGLIEAEHQGEVKFLDSEIDNRRHGVIKANGSGSTVRFDHDQIDNSGRIKAEHGGEVTFKRSGVDNDGVIKASDGGKIDFEHSDVDNTNGLIAAKGGGSTVDFDSSSVLGGVLTTASGGLIHAATGTSTFQDLTIAAGSKVDVDDGATLKLTGTINEFGTISVKQQGELDLVSATIDGGNSSSGLIKDHGVIDVFSNDTLENVTVAGGDMVVESGAKLHIESTVHLDGVNVENDGSVIVDVDPATL